VIAIDGSMGEGGGQIVRTSLALSLVTGQGFRIDKVRAGRAKPGLRKQHLTAVLAAAQLSGARVEGAGVGSSSFSFQPGPVEGGDYCFDIGSAGSTMLVLQTILPPLMRAGRPSRVVLIGGTHNPMAPPFDFLHETFVPILNRCGARLSLRLSRYGFYPAGGGRVEVHIEPTGQLRPLCLISQAPPDPGRARSLLVKLPAAIARRQLEVVEQVLGWTALHHEMSDQALSPGNMLSLAIPRADLTEIISSLGETGVAAEQVARKACQEAARYLQIGAPVGEHLADQLLISMALTGSGQFLTGPLSLHTLTNLDSIRRFVPVRFQTEQVAAQLWKVSVS
jgi:RNA 3'-terminal phosphate cyclase (ATP)